jgi:hypothetical protein
MKSLYALIIDSMGSTCPAHLIFLWSGSSIEQLWRKLVHITSTRHCVRISTPICRPAMFIAASTRVCLTSTWTDQHLQKRASGIFIKARGVTWRWSDKLIVGVKILVTLRTCNLRSLLRPEPQNTRRVRFYKTGGKPIWYFSFRE